MLKVDLYCDFTCTTGGDTVCLAVTTLEPPFVRGGGKGGSCRALSEMMEKERLLELVPTLCAQKFASSQDTIPYHSAL